VEISNALRCQLRPPVSSVVLGFNDETRAPAYRMCGWSHLG